MISSDREWTTAGNASMRIATDESADVSSESYTVSAAQQVDEIDQDEKALLMDSIQKDMEGASSSATATTDMKADRDVEQQQDCTGLISNQCSSHGPGDGAEESCLSSTPPTDTRGQSPSRRGYRPPSYIIEGRKQSQSN